MVIESSPLELWLEFRDALRQVVATRPSEEIARAWLERGARTSWYSTIILPAVASKLGLRLRLEFKRFDYALFRPHTLDEDPLILIESENHAREAHHEIGQLCGGDVPLGVLLTCAEWSDEPGDWKGPRAKKWLSKWARVVRDAPCSQRDFALGICVAEHHGAARFRLYSTALDGSGETLDAHQVALERSVPKAR